MQQILSNKTNNSLAVRRINNESVYIALDGEECAFYVSTQEKLEVFLLFF